MTTDKEIAEIVKREVEAALKAERAKGAPTRSLTEAEIGKWKDDVHQMRERAANSFRFSPEVLKGMKAACSDADLHDIARHGAVQSQSQIGDKGVGSSVGERRMAGDGRGWRESAELRPPPGVGPNSQAERIADEFARRDREDLATRLGQQLKR
jgi:hypothetical protein